MTVRKLLFQGIVTSLIAMYGCGGGGGGGSAPPVAGPTLVSISVTPTASTMAMGTNTQFTAIALYSNNTPTVLTSSVTWASSDTSKATISSTGLAVPVAAGPTTISATYSGLTGTALLTVTDAILSSLSISPPIESIPMGLKRQFTAMGTFTDNSTQDMTTSAVWDSLNITVSTISSTTGLATSVGQGTATITATHSGQTATAFLTVVPAAPVSISVFPPFASITNGNTHQFRATALMTDATTTDVTSSATWGTSNSAVATIDSAGLVTSVATGTTTISADYSMLTATALLAVTDAQLVSLSISTSSVSIAKGLSTQFTVTGTYYDFSTQDVTSQLTWLSSDTTIAMISAPGNVLGTGVGTATISALATSGSLSATTTLTVTPAEFAHIEIVPSNYILRLNATQPFTATRIYTDNTAEDVTNSVTWASSDTGIATITSGGLASPVNMGTAVISAADLVSKMTGSTLVLVRAYVTLPDTGQTGNYTATFGEDSDYTINPPSYVKNGPETTTDLRTELEWQQQDSGDAIKWVNADAYCQNLSLAGQTDWRLPTRRELMTILDLEPLQPKINSTFFTRATGTVSGKYWSSDPRDISNALDVNFDTGELSHATTDPDTGENLYVRCVRGTQLIRSIFSDNGDYTVIDYATGLMWQQDESSTMMWGDALTYCEDKLLGGHDDWRVPNSKELESLIDVSMKFPAINKIFFSGAQGTYWSSTVLSHKQTDAYYVNFDDGTSSGFGMSSTPSRVRCVRGGY